jgi:hypothetical protein
MYSSIYEILSRLTLPFHCSLWTNSSSFPSSPSSPNYSTSSGQSIYVNIGIVLTAGCDNNAGNEVQTFHIQEFQLTTSTFLPTQCTFYIRTICIQRPKYETSTRLKNETEYKKSFLEIALIMCESFSYLV